MASHDLRAPLKRLINAVDLIQDEPDEADMYLAAMRRAAFEMEDLVVGYRRLAMLQPGPTEELELASLIDRAKSRVEPEVEVRCEGDGMVVTDPTLVLQVFVNLFLNAQLYGSGGQVQCQIFNVADSDDGGKFDGNVRIRVSNPVHTDLQVDRSIFAPFRRLGSAGEGRGLGLAIVDRIVRIHSGTVDASCLDRVFTIEINLPAARSL